jgi:hypothetical protein
MLKEYPANQHKGEPRRRWFTNNYFDLIVWQDNISEIIKFQLCYDKSGKERALTWTQGRGFDHNLIDDGESSPLKNLSPILLADGLFQASEVLKRFVADSEVIEQQIRAFIIDTLRTY